MREALGCSGCGPTVKHEGNSFFVIFKIRRPEQQHSNFEGWGHLVGRVGGGGVA